MNRRKALKQQKNLLRRTLLATVISLLCAVYSIDGATLAEYRKNLRAARALTLELKERVDESDSSAETDGEDEKKLVGEIVRAVPLSEKIEQRGSIVETDNQWLAAALDAYGEEEDAAKRSEILTTVAERLTALEEKLAELENPNVSARSKDEDKQKLAEILRREEYQKPEQKQESFLQKWWRGLLDWFAGVFPRPKLSDGATSGAQTLSFALQIALYALVLGAIGFLIYRFAPAFLRNRRARENSEKKERVILGERLAAGDSAENLFGKAETLARAGELRAAIRQGYIALLCDLSDRRIVDLAQHKTNRDYLRDVRSDAALYENVSGLTGSFERHWYGSKKVAENDWNEFREKYDKIRVR